MGVIMFDNNQVRHYTGVFDILGEQITGELIYNKQNGLIVLNLIKELSDKNIFGNSFGTLSVITGKLNFGSHVTLFNNRCTKNHTEAFKSQQLNFIAESMIWSNTYRKTSKYNKLTCVLENAYQWSELSVFEMTNSGIRVKESIDKKVYNWFGAEITFSTYLSNFLYSPPKEEKTEIIQRLVVEIELIEKKEFKDFLLIRNKIISLITFAMKNNVNIHEQYLIDNDQFYMVGERVVEHYKHYLITNDVQLDIYKNQIMNYNFVLSQLPNDKNINETLTKLEPVFNLYLSVVRYCDMPIEMMFLNIVQALETFHSRFFYDNKKKVYVASVIERFGNTPNYEWIKELLLCDTQMDENCNYIILVSRLNDLLIGKYDGMFYEYYGENREYAQIIADTRHYYTHYGKSKENKALKGDELLDAIYILKILLEYHVCLVLGVDNHEKISRELHNHHEWRKLGFIQSGKT